MDWIKSNKLIGWYSYLQSRYCKFVKEYKNYHCKIIGMKSDKETKEIILWVMIGGIKSQIIPYLPKDLVIDDLMLGEFSPFDVRAITFYSLMQVKYNSQYLPNYSIFGQDFSSGKTVYIIRRRNCDSEYRKSAQELYCNMDLLGQFSQEELINIGLYGSFLKTLYSM